ncbi:uncharacterized protein M6G45_015780 isoform 1-T1 [Spheniscus humboldti]
MTLAGFLRKSLEGTLFGVFAAGDEKVDEGNPENPFPHGTGCRGVSTAPRGAAKSNFWQLLYSVPQGTIAYRSKTSVAYPRMRNSVIFTPSLIAVEHPFPPLSAYSLPPPPPPPPPPPSQVEQPSRKKAKTAVLAGRRFSASPVWILLQEEARAGVIKPHFAFEEVQSQKKKKKALRVFSSPG